MTLYDELYFEITFIGEFSEIKKVASFIKSGELDDFFEVYPEYISYDDGYDGACDSEKCSMIFSNDDDGIEIEEFDSEEFLEVFCRAAKNLYVEGRIYDADDEDFSFISSEGDTYYINKNKITRFNDELDERAYEEEREEN